MPIFMATWQDVLLTWNPLTFYGLAAAVQAIVIYLVYSVLDANSDYNTFVSALFAAVVANAGVYWLKGFSPIVGIGGTTLLYFGVLSLVSGGDLLRSLAVFAAVAATYVGLAHAVVPRTFIQPEDLGGIPQTAAQGGLEKSAPGAESEHRGPSRDPEYFD